MVSAPGVGRGVAEGRGDGFNGDTVFTSIAGAGV